MWTILIRRLRSFNMFCDIRVYLKNTQTNQTKIRVDNKASIQTFIQDLQNVNVNIYEDANTRSNFKTFLDIYKKPYGKNFPLQTQSRQ